eukprot:TRINITY_DN11867_c0_g1_i1.p1 TRINITY_DN11867_c0_g1~~TRINITY_DN11867_c0_g1_i1.p1  ORF type:complete len:173 (-),score=34.35 TRINITY_DN11867_c0_g1_i1:187-705(-)
MRLPLSRAWLLVLPWLASSVRLSEEEREAAASHASHTWSPNDIEPQIEEENIRQMEDAAHSEVHAKEALDERLHVHEYDYCGYDYHVIKDHVRDGHQEDHHSSLLEEEDDQDYGSYYGRPQGGGHGDKGPGHRGVHVDWEQKDQQLTDSLETKDEKYDKEVLGYDPSQYDYR